MTKYFKLFFYRRSFARLEIFFITLTIALYDTHSKGKPSVRIKKTTLLLGLFMAGTVKKILGKIYVNLRQLKGAVFCMGIFFVFAVVSMYSLSQENLLRPIDTLNSTSWNLEACHHLVLHPRAKRHLLRAHTVFEEITKVSVCKAKHFECGGVRTDCMPLAVCPREKLYKPYTHAFYKNLLARYKQKICEQIEQRGINNTSI